MKTSFYALLAAILLSLSACVSESTNNEEIQTDTNKELSVSSHSPTVDATDISRSSALIIVFNSVIIDSTINATSVKLQDPNAVAISASISHSNGTITITPDAILDPLTTYTVMLQTTLKNIDDQPLSSEYSWNFTTQDANPSSAGFCDPLPAASGNIVTVNPTQTSSLGTIVSSLNTGDTLLLEDGTYTLNGVELRFNTPGVTLRSASGNPDNVILDGGYISSEIVNIAASDITVAEITIQKAFTHPIHVVSSDSSDTTGTFIYRTNIIDAREQAIKINPGFNSYFVDDGTVACSSLLLTDSGRPNVNDITSDCYTGGIDAHQARNWTIRDNRIEGYWCPAGLSQHAINFWTGSRDTEVYRNVLVDNARGVGFGLLNSGSPRTYSDSPCPQSSGEYVGHYGGVVKNNFIYASSSGLLNSNDKFDCGVCLWSACEAKALHNSIYSNGSNTSSIEIRFPSTKNTKIFNNLVSHSIKIRDNASGDIQGNLENAPGSLLLNNGADENLHLSSGAATAIDQGYTSVDNISSDIDGNVRDSLPDIGADEFDG